MNAYWDIDYLQGDFVATRSFLGIDLVDGSTGVATELISFVELQALGLGNEPSGVAVRLPDAILGQ